MEDLQTVVQQTISQLEDHVVHLRILDCDAGTPIPGARAIKTVREADRVLDVGYVAGPSGATRLIRGDLSEDVILTVTAPSYRAENRRFQGRMKGTVDVCLKPSTKNPGQ
jgi:hypothetical protein